MALYENERYVGKKEPPISTRDMVSVIDETSRRLWKSLGVLEQYNTGSMMGAVDGPDSVSLKSLLDRVSSFVGRLVEDSYTRSDKPIPKEMLDAFYHVCRAVASLDSTGRGIPKIKVLAGIHGLSNSFMSSSDPESVKNLSLNESEV